MKNLCTVTRTRFITSDQFIIIIHNPRYRDYLEILKPIPKNLQNKKKQNTALPEQIIIKIMVPSSKRKWQEKYIVETQCKDFYSTLHQRR